MADIHYFPRYSQKENMVTNNTLLLFNRLYQHHTHRFKQFINLILEDSDLELDTTVKFSQQVKATGSIPDAIIEQESFKIIIETKLYGQQNLPQLIGHLASFSDEDKQILLWINTETISQIYRTEITKEINIYNHKYRKNIKFAFTTFKEICKKFKEILNPYEVEMTELINDFESFCYDANLIPHHESLMRSLPTNNTIERNFKYNLYYAPNIRNYRPHQYIGLYKEKAIHGIGEISCIIDIKFNHDTQELDIINTLQGQATPQQKQDIIDAIQDVLEAEGQNLGIGDQRFFLVNKFIPCNFKKNNQRWSTRNSLF